MTNKIKQHSDICAKLTALYERKNHDYGDSFGKSYAEWGLPMACIRLSDKLNRLKAYAKNTDLKVNDESIEDTLMDLANYAVMTLIELQGNPPADAGEEPVEPDLWDSLKHDQTCMRDCPECQCHRCANDHYDCCVKHGHSRIKCPVQDCPDFKPEKKVE